ncbi:MAG: hypothetical protein U1D36_06500 [Hydrogenophaga sp.]|jgi:hypothetical protein|uniref:hypothetical protein n=1 Tax=Hydrogenophaga sp. TaxID=1904254 RepID=UPI002730B3B9|nr:hypothetical protein [Hydrogenophaga sp.]MDP2405113.1 hypothetical protein [Hydrogenophaga sp.]MDZ4174104.1 hypothetical protein [Hydrogenophaga sp.]
MIKNRLVCNVKNRLVCNGAIWFLTAADIVYVLRGYYLRIWKVAGVIEEAPILIWMFLETIVVLMPVLIWAGYLLTKAPYKDRNLIWGIFVLAVSFFGTLVAQIILSFIALIIKIPEWFWHLWGY